MDPQAKSILTSFAMVLATSVATWAATAGIIPTASESTIAAALVSAVLYILGALIGWYKSREHTPTALIAQVTPVAMIAAINDTNNGLKVVASSVPAPVETAPLK